MAPGFADGGQPLAEEEEAPPAAQDEEDVESMDSREVSCCIGFSNIPGKGFDRRGRKSSWTPGGCRIACQRTFLERVSEPPGVGRALRQPAVGHA